MKQVPIFYNARNLAVDRFRIIKNRKAQYEIGKIILYLVLIILAALIIAAVGFNLFQKAQEPATETPMILPLIIPPIIKLSKKKGVADPLIYLIIAIVLTVIFTITAIVALKFIGL